MAKKLCEDIFKGGLQGFESADQFQNQQNHEAARGFCAFQPAA